jgi:hypothetical protein
MADQPRVSFPVYLNTNNYILVECKEEVASKLGINTAEKIKENTENLFARGGATIAKFTASGDKQQTHRQSAESTQLVHKRKASFTLKEKTVKGSYKKIQLAFPADTYIIWITQILWKEVKNKNIIQPYNGIVTYKHLPGGGRFALAKIPDDIITQSIQEYKKAVEELKAKSRKQGSVVVALEPEPANV